MSLPGPEGPRVWQRDSIHSARQSVGLGTQVLRAQEQAYQAHGVQKQAVQARRVQEQGRLKPAMTVQEQLVLAQRVPELTEPTLQLSAAYLGADVSCGSMPVSTPNTSARREARASFHEPSDKSTEFNCGTVPQTVVNLQDEDDGADDLPGTCWQG